jgi:hypothetical protein
MKAIDSKIKILYKSSIPFNEMAHLKVLKPFSENVLHFLSDLSTAVLKDKELKQYTDVVAFAFFIRKSNLLKVKQEIISDTHIRLGKGLVFHIAPSNVPINFAYSLVAALLGGNSNIVKVSSKEFPQVCLLCSAISKLLSEEKHKSLFDYLAVIQYDNEREINDYFSSICNARMIWGGDQTISELRKSAIPPRCVDITFANRYSLCLINAKSYLDLDDKKKCAIGFYNDTYGFDQNACFSPRMVYWVGDKQEVGQAREIFWEQLYKYANEKFQLDDISVSDKYLSACRTALTNKNVSVVKTKDNLIVRCEVEEPTSDIFDSSSSGGFFIEYIYQDINGLSSILSTKIQTLSYIGYDSKELADYIAEHGLYGVDRIKEVGKSHEFSFIWDGINMITALTRIVDY